VCAESEPAYEIVNAQSCRDEHQPPDVRPVQLRFVLFSNELGDDHICPCDTQQSAPNRVCCGSQTASQGMSDKDATSSSANMLLCACLASG